MVNVRDGKVGPLFFHGKESPLSNWHAKSFVVKGITFSSNEQFMMYCKAKLFGDEVTATAIMATDSQWECKRLGRKVKPFDEDVWKEKREYYVFIGALAKFRQNPSARAYLLSTVGRELVEASATDTIWGIGLSADNPDVHDRRKWRGENLLGPLLEKVRDVIAAESPMGAMF